MSSIRKALKKIAKKEGVSVEEVYREMQIAINMAYANPDPAVQAAWENIPMPSGAPRPEDVIAYCVEKLVFPHNRTVASRERGPF